MYRMGFVVLGCLLLACKGTDKKASAEGSGDKEGGPVFDSRFAAASLPYQLADTTLLNHRDAATLPATDMAALVHDSIGKKLFGKTTGIRFSPLAKIEASGKETYYVVKGTAGSKKAALLMVYDQSGQHGTTIPFLVPDNNAATTQASSIDRSYVVTRAITERNNGTVSGEGKDVLAWDRAEKTFSLIMTDLLNDNPSVLVNPLDTFAKSNRLAGDYFKNDKNLVAVRDGRYPNQILVYIHTENSSRDCIGELKGEFVMTGTNTAVYRQGGDPCVLSLTFSGNSISLNEERGCGNYRGLDCPFTGSFTRKKEESQKEAANKPKQRKRTQ